MRPAVLLGMLRGVDHMAGALLERADLDIIVFHDEAAVALARAGIPHQRFSDFLSDSARQRILKQTESRASLAVKTLYGEGIQHAFGFAEAEWHAVRECVLKGLSGSLAETLADIEALSKMAAMTDLRLIMVPEDISRDTRTIVSTGRRLGIPSLHLIHGFPYGSQNCHDFVTADLVAVYSQTSKAIYEAYGAEPGRVVVTGNPSWDVYAAPPLPETRKRACHALDLDPARPVVVYALTDAHGYSATSVRNPDYHIQCARRVRDAFAELRLRHPDWQFVMRPHPGVWPQTEVLNEWLDQGERDLFAVDRSDAYDAVVMADVLLCTQSNLGIEALLLGTPVINFVPEDIAGPVVREGIGVLFDEDDAVLPVRDSAELVQTIEAALADETVQTRLLAARAHSIERFNAAHDGRATERVCALALDMMGDTARYLHAPGLAPGFLDALAAAVPKDAETVLVLGRHAGQVAAALQSERPNISLTTAAHMPEAGAVSWDAAVLTEPVQHDTRAASILRGAAALTSATGCVVALLRNGTDVGAAEAFASEQWTTPRPGHDPPANVGQFSLHGLHVTASRCGLEVVSTVEARGHIPPPGDTSQRHVAAWAVCLRHAPPAPSAFQARNAQRRKEAERANKRGEEAFARGDIPAALSAFAEACACFREGLYLSNLATALHAAGRPEDAFARLLDALNADPDGEAAWENLAALAPLVGKEEEAQEFARLYHPAQRK